MSNNDIFQRIELKRLQVGIERTIAKKMAVRRPEVIVRDIGQDLTIGFRHFVWAEDIGTLSVRHPANWWEAVKERFLKRWLKVKYTVTTADVKATYPDFRPSVPDEKMVIKLIKKANYERRRESLVVPDYPHRVDQGSK